MGSTFINKWGFYWLLFIGLGFFIFGSANVMEIFFSSTALTIFCIIISTVQEYIEKVDDKYKEWFFIILFGIGIGIGVVILKWIYNLIDTI